MVKNEISIETNYFEHSSASGALFIFVFLDDSGVVDLSRAVYLAMDEIASHNHTVTFSFSAGRMAVLAYDIENDRTLASGVGYPAVTKEHVISKIITGIVTAH